MWFSSILPSFNPFKRKLSVRFVAMPHKSIEDALSFAEVTSYDVLYDLGCGEGDILIAAATAYGARCIGLDIDAALVATAQVKAVKAGVHEKVRFLEGNFGQIADLERIRVEDATVVILFLLPETLARLLPLLRERMQSGTRIVSITCKPIPDTWPADRVGYTTGFEIPGEPIPMYYWSVLG
ncbi:MAG TPA: class I SAM-dependent methyltransferase [Nitrospirales bacterium]|nr:class I SAM-dependent methyltransferase [Nitrospirales bacterium]